MLKSKCLVYVVMAVPVLLFNYALYISFVHCLKFQLIISMFIGIRCSVEQATMKFYAGGKFTQEICWCF